MSQQDKINTIEQYLKDLFPRKEVRKCALNCVASLLFRNERNAEFIYVMKGSNFNCGISNFMKILRTACCEECDLSSVWLKLRDPSQSVRVKMHNEMYNGKKLILELSEWNSFLNLKQVCNILREKKSPIILQYEEKFNNHELHENTIFIHFESVFSDLITPGQIKTRVIDVNLLGKLLREYIVEQVTYSKLSQKYLPFKCHIKYETLTYYELIKTEKCCAVQNYVNQLKTNFYHKMMIVQEIIPIHDLFLVVLRFLTNTPKH